MNKNLNKFIAECIGTFVLVFLACGTAMLTAKETGSVNLVATALTFGLVIVGLAYAIGPVSGCHINPAVSLGMLVSKKMTVKEFFIYIGAQFLGAIVGAALLYGIFKMAGFDFIIWATNSYTLGNVTNGGTIVASLLVEIVLTAIFVFVILGVTSKEENGRVAGIVIGLTLTLVHLFGIYVTGTSVNPARSFGPALMSWIFGNGTVALTQVWLFIVGPLIGGTLAACLHNYFKRVK